MEGTPLRQRLRDAGTLLRSGRDWEMQATPLRQRLGDAGYSAPAEIGRCRLLRFGNDWEMEGTLLRQRLRDAGTDAAQLIPTTEKGSQK
ncbi:MAG: hypothetical protein SO214_01635 [Prevotella pectinovora]|uniref:hypothetical protein n=1 Tax=Prevotella pectinovora TaxID=1602169 RepID=UPI002A83A1A0|nr:hypothetical protein [Prevotella pectinovora]MDY4778151.1 hypothetical protein [Prevotella pectinovora]